MQANGWTDADLAAIQRAWESQEFTTSLVWSFNGERVFGTIAIEQILASNETTYQLIFNEYANMLAVITESSGFKVKDHDLPAKAWQEFFRRQIYCRVWRFAWSHQAQLRDLKNMQRLIELMRQGAKDRSYADIESSIDQLFSGANRAGFYDRLRFPEPDSLSVMSKTVLRAMKLETDRSLSICAIALKRYALRHAKPPAKLDTLVPEFLPAVPVDYMDGKPIKYRFNSDGSFALYSVGEDGKDDGGDLTLPKGSKSKDLWRRRDYVWPAPATPEEIAEYRKETTNPK